MARIISQNSLPSGRRVILFGSGSCLNKLERVIANIIEMLHKQAKNHIAKRHIQSYEDVGFYALLFVSSCRSKQNYPAANTERYFENRYMIKLQ